MFSVADPSSSEVRPSGGRSAVTIDNPLGRSPFVIVCDHASNHIPVAYGELGLVGADLTRHIAWDPGALEVARALAGRLDATLVASAVSRLLIDCNRGPEMVDAIPEVTETTPVPGNRGLDGAERARRVAAFHAPFHAAIDEVIAAKARNGPAALIGLHTFNPVYKGTSRPWHVGILYDRDTSLSAPLLAALRRDDGLVVGENQPYSPKDRVYYTLDRHAQAQGRASVMIEIRNDLVTTRETQNQWAARLAGLLGALLPASRTARPDQPVGNG